MQPDERFNPIRCFLIASNLSKDYESYNKEILSEWYYSGVQHFNSSEFLFLANSIV